ncbi:MAG: hypothetical protein V4548_03410 [Bacteroidota bacterium]
MTKKNLLLAFAFLTMMNASAQIKFEAPNNLELKTASDFTKYEKDIVQAEKWLEETDLNKEIDKRKEINGFVLQWISGSPTVSVEINDALGKIYGENNQLLALYLASYARNYIELKDKATNLTAAKAGILSMINVYKKGIDVIKSSEMDKVIKLEKENKLDAYIKSMMQ